jgi:uncharacterized protein YutE (UPF0331/DUF86 family)
VVDRHALSHRLSALEGYLAELRSFRDVSRTEFVQEPAIHHLAERYLHLACECVLDIVHHVIAEQGYREATTYRDAIEVLKEEGFLDPDMAERLSEWMGFRNVLVHLYLAIDHGRVHETIEQELGDLEAFAGRMAKLLAE